MTHTPQFLGRFVQSLLVQNQIGSFNEFLANGLQTCFAAPAISVEQYSNIVTGHTEDQTHVLSVRAVRAGGVSERLSASEYRTLEKTHGIEVFMDIEYRVREMHTKKIVFAEIWPRVPMFVLPVMVGCTHSHIRDFACGYFIVRGHERIIRCQEVSVHNKAYVLAAPHGSVIVDSERDGGVSRCSVFLRKMSSKHEAEISVMHLNVPVYYLYVHFPGLVDEGIPLGILLAALCGDTFAATREEMYMHVLSTKTREDWHYTELVDRALCAVREIHNAAAAARYIGLRSNYERSLQQPDNMYAWLVDNKLLPHLNATDDPHRAKSVLLLNMVHLLLRETDLDTMEVHAEQRDHFSNRVLRTPGMFVEFMLKAVWAQHVRGLRKQIGMHLARFKPPTRDLLAEAGARMTRRIEYHMVTGNWTFGGKYASMVGMTVEMPNKNSMDMLAALRSVVKIQNKEIKNIRMRELQCMHWGYYDPSSTPDGKPCGLVLSLASTVCVTVERSARAPVLLLLEQSGVGTVMDRSAERCMLFSVDGIPRCFCTRWEIWHLYLMLKEARMQGRIGYEVSLHFYDGERLDVVTTPGRLKRPLLCLQTVDGKIEMRIKESDVEMLLGARDPRTLLFGDFVRRGLLEWLDPVESYLSAQIAHEYNPKIDAQLTLAKTHAEVHAAAFMGVEIMQCVFSEHNQSPRNTYVIGLLKQAMPAMVPVMPKRVRAATLKRKRVEWEVEEVVASGRVFEGARVLRQSRDLPAAPCAHLHSSDAPTLPEFEICYAQSSAVPSLCETLEMVPNMYIGTNAVCAIMIDDGYTQEDAIKIRQGSLDRGLMRTLIRMRLTVCINPHDLFDPHRMRMKPQSAGLFANIDTDGLPKVGAMFSKGMCLIALCDSNHKDHSIYKKHDVPGQVTECKISDTDDGRWRIEITMVKYVAPDVGDKLSDLHGQKGVIGFIERDVDAPVMQDGMSPDIIVNTHCIPSRMTIGKLYEMLAAWFNVCVARSRSDWITGIPFQQIEQHEMLNFITEQLRRNGFNPLGQQRMHSGRTGRPLNALIFVGGCYYMRLKHLVVNKMQVRAHGPVDPVTQHPVAGRRRHGGIRFGEMERDVMIAHGCALTLNNIFKSDTLMHVCNKCKKFCIAVHELGTSQITPECRWCRCRTSATSIAMPYAAKLLFQETMSMGVGLRFNAVAPNQVKVP